MPRYPSNQESVSVSYDSLVGDAVSFNGVEDQSVRRTHMREQTMARQAAERRLVYPLIRRGEYDYRARLAEREIEVREELARIHEAHQAWLCAHSGSVAEPPSQQLPPDTMEQPAQLLDTSR